jgi:pSer/pThr/pTyr-binding forkhead associated (FHA) protein
MTLVTLRVLDGADRGRVFEDMPTPLTIGREEGNPIQLNDERISRFHLKIQEDDGKLVLTDLESTNGTKVNGENVQLCIVRPGDLILLGRTMLLVGSREEIAERLASLRGADLSEAVTLSGDELAADSGSAQLDFELNFGDERDVQTLLHTVVPPELPSSLGPGQAAQITELLQYFHLRVRGLIQSVHKEKGDRVTLESRQWQNLLDLQARLATYLKQIGEPGE